MIRIDFGIRCLKLEADKAATPSTWKGRFGGQCRSTAAQVQMFSDTTHPLIQKTAFDDVCKEGSGLVNTAVIVYQVLLLDHTNSAFCRRRSSKSFGASKPKL